MDFLLFTNLFVAIPVTCLAAETQFLIGLSPNPHFLLLVYFATLFTYCFHRVYPIRHRYEGVVSARFSWLQKNRTLFNLIMAIALLAIIALVLLEPSTHLFWFVPVGLISLFYTVAIFPLGGRWLRLRDIPYLKVFLIVGVVTIVTTYLPNLYDSNNLILSSSEFMMIVLARALFLGAITLPFDIRDLEFDRETEVRTIPGKFGVRNTRIISTVLILSFMIVETLRYFEYGGAWAIYFSLIISGIVAGIFILRSRSDGSEYFYSLALEGTMIVQLLLVLLALHAF